MNLKALALTIIGVLVAAFYALESILTFQANGVSAPLLVKMLVGVAGAYVFGRNVKRIKAGQPTGAA